MIIHHIEQMRQQAIYLIISGLLLCQQIFGWNHLSFDSANFLCDHFDTFCTNILSEMGCSEDATERIIAGCVGGDNLGTDFIGTCTCLGPVYFDQAGARVVQQLMQNRMAADVPWMIEPWNSGPPYDLLATYPSICKTMLDRLGCREENQVINATSYAIVDGKKTTNLVCTCGKLTDSSKHVSRMIMDKFNDYDVRSTPVFADPIYLSVPLSICVTLICGKLGAVIAVYLKLPPIIGFLLAGLGIQNILNPMFIKGAGFPFPSPASEIKLLALIIVLMRAGLSIKFDEIKATAVPTFLLCLIPYMAEFFAWMFIGKEIFGWDIIDMGLWASVMAPLGPSVVISGLLQLIGNGKKDYGYPTKQIVISTPIEAVIAIVMFGIFQNLEQSGTNTLYPWVEPLPLYANCLLIPVNILFSTVLGIVSGIICSRYIDWRSKIKTDFIWVRVNKNPQMGSSVADLVFVLVVICYTMYSLCNLQYIQQCSGVLVVFVCCITVSILADAKVTVEIAQGLKGIWIFAEVFLFTLTGTSLSFDSTNGPLYGQRGLDSTSIQKVLGMMFIGTGFRGVALLLIIGILYFTFPPHRQTWKWMLPFWLTCWIYQLPKATVQATLGSVPYYQHTIPGDTGVKEGLFIAQSTAFTVLIFAPLGAILTNYVAAPLSLYLTGLDKEAGWKPMEFRYASHSPYYEKNAVASEVGSSVGMPSSASGTSLDEMGTKDDDMHEPETIEDLVHFFVGPKHDDSDEYHDMPHGFIDRVRSNTIDAMHFSVRKDSHSHHDQSYEAAQQNEEAGGNKTEGSDGFLQRVRRNTIDALHLYPRKDSNANEPTKTEVIEEKSEEDDENSNDGKTIEMTVINAVADDEEDHAPV